MGTSIDGIVLVNVLPCQTWKKQREYPSFPRQIDWGSRHQMRDVFSFGTSTREALLVMAKEAWISDEI